MKYKTLLSMVAFAGISQMASAGTDFSCTSNGPWNDGRTWNSQANIGDPVPGLNDRALIPNAKIVTVTANTTVGLLSVSNGGTLNIDSTKVLTLDGDVTSGAGGSTGVQVVAGTINVDGELHFTSRNHTLSEGGSPTGTGQITLADPSAVLEIADTYMVTNRILIQGEGAIRPAASGTATFQNEQMSSTVGAVMRANVQGGTLSLHQDLKLVDVYLQDGPDRFRPAYEAVAEGAVLQFNRASDNTTNHPKLEGNFSLDGCGVLDFAGVTVQTLGDFLIDSGEIFIDSSYSFVWSSGSLDFSDMPYDSGSCNP